MSILPRHKHKRFSLSHRIIDEGFDSMAHFVKLSGESHQTLINWSKNKPDRFGYILAGVKLRNKMSLYQKIKKTEITCKSYNTIELEQDHRDHINLAADDTVVFESSIYRIGSVVSYAIKNNDCPIESIERAIANHHELHWASQSAIVLTSQKQKKVNHIKVNLTQIYRFEGRLFKFELANNNNLALVQQAFPKGFF